MTVLVLSTGTVERRSCEISVRRTTVLELLNFPPFIPE